MTELMYNNKFSETFQKTQSVCKNLDFNGYIFQGIVVSPRVWKVEFELLDKKCKIYLFANEVKLNYQELREIVIDKIIFDRIEY